MGKRKSGALLSILVLGVTSGGLLALAPSVAAATQIPCSTTRHTAKVAETFRANDRIQDSPGFTGIALLDQCGPVDVYGTAASDPKFQESTRGTDPVEDYRFHVVANSLSRLLQVQDVVSSDVAALRSEGVDILREWPDMTTGKERIEVIDASPSVLSDLSSRYGGNYVDPVSVTNAKKPHAEYDPSNDSSPWYGGDYIEWTDSSGAENGCTEAYGVHAGSTQYILTAGHCSAPNGSPITGESWINGVIADQYGDLSGSLSTMGTVVYNSLGGKIDAALIQTPSWNQWWNGWYTSAVVNSQRTQARAVVGQTVCTNGAYEGTICSGVVQQSGYLGCISVTGFSMQWCEEILASDPNGNVISGEGDSGGGVMALGPTQYALGTISAGDGALNCPHWTWRGAVCSSNVYFLDLPFDISRISSYYGTQFYMNT